MLVCVIFYVGGVIKVNIKYNIYLWILKIKKYLKILSKCICSFGINEGFESIIRIFYIL